MPRYIDADALIDDLLSYAEANKGTYHEEGFKNAITVVEDQPTADVVEIVRCRDCKKHDWCSIEDLALNDETFFCKWGERRTDDA